jgi:hypothetical protein
VRWFFFLNWIDKKINLIFEFLDDCVNDGVISEENKLQAQDNKGTSINSFGFIIKILFANEMALT